MLKNVRIDRIEIVALQEVLGTGVLELSMKLGARFVPLEEMELRLGVRIRQVGRVRNSA